MKKTAVCCVFLFCVVLAISAPLPPAHLLLPSNTLFFVSIPNAAGFRELTNSTLALLWADPAMKPFTEKFAGKFQANVVAPIDRELGLAMKEIIASARGQVTLAGVLVAGSGNSNPSLALVWILDAKDQSPALARQLNQSRQQWLASGRQNTRQTLQGSEFVTFTITNKLWAVADTNSLSKQTEIKGTNSTARVEVTIGQVDTVFFAATSSKALEALLARRAGVPSAPPALQSWDSSLDAASTPGAHLFAFLNVKMLSDLFFAKPTLPGAREGAAPSMTKVFSALGLGDLKSLSLNYQRVKEGERLQFALSIRETERKGLLRMLAFEKHDATPPEFIPSGISKFTRVRINLPKTWAALENTLGSAFPSATGALKLMFDYAGKDKDPSFDIRRELIGHLGNDFITYNRTALTNSADSRIYLIGSPEPEKLARAIRIVLSSLGPPGTHIQQTPGNVGYSVIIPGFGTASSNGLHQTAWYFGVRTGYLAAAQSRDALEQCLQDKTLEKPLRQTDRLLKGFNSLGLETPALLGFTDPGDKIRDSFDSLKGGTNLFTTVIKILLAKSGRENELGEWVDFRLLPSFNSVSNYFSLAFHGGGSDSEKLYWKIFTATPNGKTN